MEISGSKFIGQNLFVLYISTSSDQERYAFLDDPPPDESTAREAIMSYRERLGEITKSEL